MIPPVDDLRQLYADQIGNTDVYAVSCWYESNHAAPSDDEAYVTKALEEGPGLMEKFDRIISGI